MSGFVCDTEVNPIVRVRVREGPRPSSGRGKEKRAKEG